MGLGLDQGLYGYYVGVSAVIVRRLTPEQAENLKGLIRERGLSLGSFARYAGLNPQTLSRWLSGSTSVQAETELKVWRALRSLQPVMGLHLPPEAETVIEKMPRLQTVPRRGEGGRWVAQRRKAEARLPVASFVRALGGVPPWEAWTTWRYRLLPSARLAASFKREMVAGRVWVAFPEVFPDEAAWQTFAPLTVMDRPLWP